MKLVSRRNSNPRRGFSIVELLCAVMVLGIGVAGLTQGLTTALGSTREAAIHTTASLLAAGQMETLRADNFLVEGETEGEGTGDLSNYSWRQTVEETATQGLYEVTIVVEHSGNQVYELKTLLFDPPLSRDTQPNSRNNNQNRRRS